MYYVYKVGLLIVSVFIKNNLNLTSSQLLFLSA